jgi:hypothetical protein
MSEKHVDEDAINVGSVRSSVRNFKGSEEDTADNPHRGRLATVVTTHT